MSTQATARRLVWSDPLDELARTIEEEATTTSRIIGPVSEVALMMRTAERIREALASAGAPTWLPLAEAAEKMGVQPDTLRWRCRNKLEATGQAKKDGKDWLVHATIVAEEGKA
jgi:hypothetical protein